MKTKMTLLGLAGILFSMVQLQAQSGTTGIKGGINSSNLSGFAGNNRLSGHIGVYFNNNLNRRWSIQPEILFSGEGQRYFSDGEERTLALDYIQIPLMFQYHAVNQLYFEFGPQFGILASARDKGIDGSYNARSDFAPTQIGINLGLGLNVNSNIGFYGRYSFGLTDVSRFDNIIDQSGVGQVGMTIRLR